MSVAGVAPRGRDAQGHARAELVAAIAETITDREDSQAQAARIFRTDQPILSQVLRGRTAHVSLDKLPEWLMALRRPVELWIGRYPNSLAILTVVLDGRNSTG